MGMGGTTKQTAVPRPSLPPAGPRRNAGLAEAPGERMKLAAAFDPYPSPHPLPQSQRFGKVALPL